MREDCTRFTMNHLWRNSGVLIVLGIVSAYTWVAARGPNGIPMLMEKQRQVKELRERNATLAAENERKRERIERLKTSRAEQELEIRERLKLVKPGETQFILPDPPKEPAPQQK